jgi:hypothetical protein
MAVARFANSKPLADTDTLLYTVERTALTSLVAVNVSGFTNISAWIVPAGEDENPENWIYYVDNVGLTNRNSFETFRIAVNVGDQIYVKSTSGEVTFFINGIYDVAGRANITTGAQEPESPQIGDIWIDDSEEPVIVYFWTGSIWKETGIVGPEGPSNTLNIGTVTSGDSNSTAAATITGDSPEQTLNLTLKQGPTGPQGTFDIFENAPTGPDQGDVWFNSSDGRFYVYYDSYWVEALSNEAGPTGPTGPAGIGTTVSVTDPLRITGPTESRTIGLSVTGPISVTGPSGSQTVGVSVASPILVTGPAGAQSIGIQSGSAGGVQSWDEDLQGIANATLTSAGLLRTNGSGTFTSDTTAYLSTSSLPTGPSNTNSAKSYGYIGMPQVLDPSTGYVISAVDAGDHIYMTTTGRNIVIPANSATPLEIGTTVVVINGPGVTTTISINSDTLALAGTTTTGTRTLAQNGMATLVKVTATRWIASGNGLS